MDANDNDPEFQYNLDPSIGMYLGLVSVGPEGEESPPNTCLLRVTATDADSGDNGKV